jgi:pre-rRNA-processing protein IPI3
MLTESFVAATLAANKAVAHTTAALKDVGIFLHEFQPQNTIRHGYKKSSSQPGCVALGESHIFAAQADRAVVNVYSRERGNQEATVPFPERIHSVAFAQEAGILVLGTAEGRLALWEVATGRLVTSAASHLNAVSCLCITPGNEYIISGSADSSVHVWSLLKLVSFPRANDSGAAADEPSNLSSDHTFSNHRSAISAITCGHSTKSDTNFAVSASGDGTCYIWHIESCQTLRTLLLPTPVTSIILDPADRVIYFGCKDGRIHSWDLFQHAAKDKVLSSGATDFAPIQLQAQDAWAAPSSETGTANCLTLSYDGMSLISGHSSGAVIRWDVAKHRILNEIANFGQPVTNIEMPKPANFPNQKRPRYALPNIVKPNLEFTASTNNGTCGVPANYNLHLMITNFESTADPTDFDKALSGGGFPQNMLDKSLRSLAGGGSGLTSTNGADGNNTLKVGKLEDEVVSLKQQIAALHRVEEKRKQRRLAKMKVQDAMDLEKRKAYFEAQKKGQDGDEAMKIWEEKKKKAMADLESDDELSDDKMDVG